MNYYLDILEKVSKLATVVFKFGIFIGVLSILIYSYRVNHFPQGISLGDGLLFIIVASSFGLIYILFVISLISIGVLFSPLFKFLFWCLEKILRKPLCANFADFQWISILYSVFSFIIICYIYKSNPKVIWQIPILVLLMYIFYSIFLNSTNEEKEYSKTLDLLNSKNITSQGVDEFKLIVGNKNNILVRDPKDIKLLKYTSIVVIVLAPLVFSGANKELHDASMRLLSIREENVRIYTEDPYASIIPSEFRSKNQPADSDFTAYDNINVIFRGFGKSTFISFLEDKNEIFLEIKNESLIVEKTLKKII